MGLAQVIWRPRDLDMPVAKVKAVVATEDIRRRNALIARHLERLESASHRPDAIDDRDVDDRLPTIVLVQLAGEQAAARAGARGLWAVTTACSSASVPCHHDNASSVSMTVWTAAAGCAGTERCSTSSAVFAARPTGHAARRRPSGCGRARRGDRDPVGRAGRRAPRRPDDVDITYGVLGGYAATHEISVDGPLRETYLVSALDTDNRNAWRTKVGWPIFQTTTTSEAS